MATHIASNAIIIEGRYHRQRCVWCGALLIDDDLSMQAVPTDQADKAIPCWKTGGMVRVEPGNPRSSSKVESDKMPDDCCYVMGIASKEG